MKNKDKPSITVIVLSVLLVLCIVFSAFQYFQRYSAQEVKDREKLLVAVMWEMNNTENKISRDEIKNITVLKSKAGVYPFHYDVVINLKNGKQILYAWKDRNQTEVEKISIE